MRAKVVLCLAAMVLGLCVSAAGREIRLPAEAAIGGRVIIADWFYEQVDRDTVIPREFQAWPGAHGIHDADWFDVRILASPGDVILLAPGTYVADVWVFAAGVTIKTEGDATALATIRGSLEVDADRVLLERVAVVGNDGHGIEINREVVRHITLRGCLSADNLWVGIHLIGAKGTITEYRIEDCVVTGNGWDGIDARYTTRLVLSGNTITGNGHAGVYIESYVEHVELDGNEISGNGTGDVVYKYGS